MVKKPSKPLLKIVQSSDANGIQPPRKLGKHGMTLWNAVMNEYTIDDRGGIEVLAQICSALDRAEQFADEIERDGPVISIRGVLREHPCARNELACRAFVCRGLVRLGLNVESVRPQGRPAGWSPPTRGD